MHSTRVDLPDGVALTYDELSALFRVSADSDSGNRYELFDGALVVTGSPLVAHQRVLVALVQHLRAHVVEHGLGEVLVAPVDVIFDQRNLCVPDLVFVAAANADRVTRRAIEGGPPDLVVEILSPSTAKRDRGFKRALYGERGVKEYWIIDAELGLIERHASRGGGLELVETLGAGATLASPLFPGLALPLSAVF